MSIYSLFIVPYCDLGQISQNTDPLNFEPYRKYHISVQLYVKTLRFIHYMLNSTNPIVSYIGHLAKPNSSSPIGKNMAYLRYKYGILYTDILSCNINKIPHRE